MNDSVESKFFTDDLDVGEKLSPTRQHSMRRSRTSGEIERDPGLTGPPSSTRVLLPTTLAPVTPLRWKSSKRLDSKKDKPQEETKPCEVVKEEGKTLEAWMHQDVLEEVKNKAPQVGVKEQEKVTVVQPDVNGIEVTYETDSPGIECTDQPKEAPSIVILPSRSDEPRLNLGTASRDFSVKENNRGDNITNYAETTVLQQGRVDNAVQEKARSHKPLQVETGHGRGVGGQTKLFEEIPTHNMEQGMDQSNSGESLAIDRKPPAGDIESSVITIDFLRARLLAERASSKAARERIQQLSKKVIELESKLEQEIHSRERAEEATKEAILKLQSSGYSATSPAKEICELTKTSSEQPGESQELCPISKAVANTSQTQSSASGGEITSLPEEESGKQQIENSEHEEKIPGQGELKSTTAETPNLGDLQFSSLDVQNGESGVLRKDTSTLYPVKNIGEGILEQNSAEMKNPKEIELEEVRQLSVNSTLGAKASHVDMQDCDILRPTRQEKRSALEERLRNMWDQMTEEMAALAFDRNQEELVREELLNWMGQVPAVLQDILPRNPEEKKLVSMLSSESMQLEDAHVLLADSGSSLMQMNDKAECPSIDGTSHDEKKRIDSANKKVASLIEQYEAQESVQRAWEQNYYAKQNSAGRRRSTDGSMSRTTSGSETPPSGGSQPDSQQETLKEGHTKAYNTISSHDRVPRFDVHVTSSPIILSDKKTAGNILPIKVNGTVDVDAPRFDGLYAYTEPPSVPRENIHKAKSGSRPHGGTYSTKDPGQGVLGVERSFDPSLVTPPLYGESRVPNPRDSRADLRDFAERPLVLEQKDHNYGQGASRGGRYQNHVGQSSRSSMGREEVHNVRGLPGWRILEEDHLSHKSHNGGNPSHWDAPSVSSRSLHERVPPYSQAGHSNAYVRPEVPSGYPLRNDEREIYRGRMESVSRSMEGLGTSWRSSSDAEVWQGDEGLLYAEKSETSDSRLSWRGDARNPSVAQESSRRSTADHTENVAARSATGVHLNKDRSLSLAYPGWHFSREVVTKRPSNLDNSGKDSTTKVTEVLRALQIAKFNIQNSKTKSTNVYAGHSSPGSEKADNSRRSYGSEIGDARSHGSAAVSGWSHQEQQRYSSGHLREHGSRKMQMPTSSTSFTSDHLQINVLHGDDRPLAGRSSPVLQAQSSFVDKMSVGNGIQLFFP